MVRDIRKDLNAAAIDRIIAEAWAACRTGREAGVSTSTDVAADEEKGIDALTRMRMWRILHHFDDPFLRLFPPR